MALKRLDVSAGDYLAEHGQRSVSASVRQWVAHPASVRGCGQPLGAAVPVIGGERPALWSLKQCRNRFVDPYCSGWFRTALSESIERVLRQALDDGLIVGMAVLTVRHQRGESLASVMDWAQRSWHAMNRRGSVRRCGWEWMRVWDVVVGGRNGPHPHFNVPFVVPSRQPVKRGDSAGWANAHEFGQFLGRQYLRAQWLHRKTPDGERRTVTLERGVKVVPVHLDNVSELSWYSARHVEKIGAEAVDDRYRISKGYGLLDLACMAHSGQQDAGKLLAACAVDLNGKRSYSVSAGWRRLAAGLPAPDEDSDADLILAGQWVLGMLPSRSYVVHRRAVDELLDNLRGQSLEAQRTAWRDLDQRAVLGAAWFPEPVAAAEWSDA